MSGKPYVCKGAIGVLILLSMLNTTRAEDSNSHTITAAVMPCDTKCEEGGRHFLSITKPGDSTSFPGVFPTGMEKVTDVHVNTHGNLIIAGMVTDSIEDVEIIQALTPKPVDEFWPGEWSISPDGEYIATTVIRITHGEGAGHSDKMVYIYDANQSRSSVDDADTAIPVFPSLLVHKGDLAVMKTPDSQLSGVYSDFKWLSHDKFMFMAYEPFDQMAISRDRTRESHLVPVTISKNANGNWKNPKIHMGKPFKCDPSKNDIDTILAECPQDE